MSEKNPYPVQGEDHNAEEELKLLLVKYIRYWRWFIIGIFVTLILAFIYNRYATVIYNTEGSIQILKKEESGIDMSEMEGGSSLFSLREVNLENEMEIIQSRRLTDSVVQKLGLQTTYQKLGALTTSEIWENQRPFIVEWVQVDSARTKEFPLYKIRYTAEDELSVRVEEGREGEIDQKFKLPINGELKFGGYRFKIMANPDFKKERLKGQEFTFQHISRDRAIDKIQKAITVEPVGKQSEILSISFQGPNKQKNEDIVDTFIQKFNADGISDKQLVSKRTEEFVTERANLLFEELDTVEGSLVKFKQENDIVTIESTAQQWFGKESKSEKEHFEIATQVELTKAFAQELEHGESYSLLPANLGIDNSSINELTKQYNEAVMERNERLVSATAENPTVRNIESQLDNLKENILGSIRSYIRDLEQSIGSISEREAESVRRLRGLAEQEKGIRGIMRQQEVKERLYLFLLQKREESALEYAITAPSVKLVDAAYTARTPVAPKTKIIYLAALILGGLLPFGVLYLKFLFDTKIESKEDIKRKLPNISILSEIPLLKKGEPNLIFPNDSSNLAESFRILRTNLGFMLPKKEAEEGKVIFVTSSIKGEGKTFTTVNIAHALAATGKRVLIVGADLRNPQPHTYYGINKNREGLTSYLVDSSTNFEELLIHGDDYFENLDMIISGAIPPNPAELLNNGNFEVFIAEAKKRYDYVVVDTAPTILVTDTILISEHADATVYMIKSKHTEKGLLEHIDQMEKSEKLKNIGIVLNGVSQQAGYGYNYGYGYGYSADKQAPIWKFWKR